MLPQIVSHTPTYVWAILAVLIWRGVAASAARSTSLRGLCLLPLIMLWLSFHGVSSIFGSAGAAPWLWLTGMLASAGAAWHLGAGSRVRLDRQSGLLTQPGSWLPLLLMLAIFCMKYAVAVNLAMAPGMQQRPAFMAAVCLMYGVLSGVFAGRLVGGLAAYREARRAPAGATELPGQPAL